MGSFLIYGNHNFQSTIPAKFNKMECGESRLGEEQCSTLREEIKREYLESDEGINRKGSIIETAVNNAEKFFEVEVNYLPNLNVVRFKSDEINEEYNANETFDDEAHEESYDEEEDNCEETDQEERDISESEDTTSASIINDISKKVFEKYKKLSEEYSNHNSRNKTEELKCDVCEHSFSDASLLAKHKTSHLDEGLYACGLCDKKFVKKVSLRVHNERNHSLTKRHICSVCDKRFARVGDLNQHKAMHSGVKKFTCADCPKEFARSGGLRRHKLVHTGYRPHQCEICFKGFTQAGDLKKHLMYHRGEKPYQCEVCLKFFSQLSNLNQHRKTHSGIRSFFCDVCYKVFQSNSNLKHHQLIHSANKCYECDICGKGFIRGGDLKKHKVIHSGERRFSCYLCLRPFLRNGDLKKHMAIHRDVAPQQKSQLPEIKSEMAEWNNVDYTDPEQLASQFPILFSQASSTTQTSLAQSQNTSDCFNIVSSSDVQIKKIKLELPQVEE